MILPALVVVAVGVHLQGQHVVVEQAIPEEAPLFSARFPKAGAGFDLRKRIIGLFCAKYVISEATGCFISICDH